MPRVVAEGGWREIWEQEGARRMAPLALFIEVRVTHEAFLVVRHEFRITRGDR
jgi:hypothetical protein